MNNIADKIAAAAAAHATDTRDYIRRVCFITALLAADAFGNPNAKRIMRSRRRLADLWWRYSNG